MAAGSVRQIVQTGSTSPLRITAAQLTADADALAFMLCRWTRGFARPARSLPRLGDYLQRMLALTANTSSDRV